MKSRAVTSITSNEDDVRLRIFDGVIPLDEAGKELIRIAQAQAAAAESRLAQAFEHILELKLSLFTAQDYRGPGPRAYAPYGGGAI